MERFEQQQHEFRTRHIGPSEKDTADMLSVIGEPSLESLVDKTVPANIRMQGALEIPAPMSEAEYLSHISEVGKYNRLYKNYIGQGYYDTITPSVILRNIFENPGWYTQYTPYQAEIAQGRLESLLNYQTMVSDLTGLPVANASLLDEATATAEAMTMFFNILNRQENIERPRFFVDREVFPQTLDVLLTRAVPVGIEIVIGDLADASLDETYFGAFVQYPNDKGAVIDHRAFIDRVHAVGAYVVMATDLLALTLLTSPGELGADVACGSAQRLGIPMGYGGPHAAFFAAREDFKRQMPGRIIGVSIDARGERALRMALQTREQHIKREKATSNICTAQALLANMAAMYAVFHGPQGLKDIALRISTLAHTAAETLKDMGFRLVSAYYFDTVMVQTNDIETIRFKAQEQEINLRFTDDGMVGFSIDETTTPRDLFDLINCFSNDTDPVSFTMRDVAILPNIPAPLTRQSAYLTHPVFNTHRSE
ncbi:MAG: glycine dehydrogenase, partial [bacterium]